MKILLFPFPCFLGKIPSASISASKTPTILLRNASLPPQEVLEKTEPRHFTSPEELVLPTPSLYMLTSFLTPPLRVYCSVIRFFSSP
ncbi:MAG TPA: hypothetical protein VE089_09430 [Nitrososphaeraceae archaeon]|nr:hypothetical protein [Nitrososphaeraceae archaeon]